MKNTNQSGFGLLLVIAIVAVVAIGGVATYKAAHKSAIETGAQMRMEAADRDAGENKNKIRAKLTELHALLETTTLSAEAKADVAANIASDIREQIAKVSDDASAEVKAEISSMNAELESALRQFGGSAKANGNANATTSAGAKIDVRSTTTISF